MKTLALRPALFAALAVCLTLLSACQSAPTAQLSASRALAFASEVRGSPDLLGGLVGREAMTGTSAPTRGEDNAQLQRAQFDQRAYCDLESFPAVVI